MFQDKVVLITGSAHGIGLCAAERFRSLSARVYGLDKEGTGPFCGDLADKGFLESSVRRLLEAEGHIDILINNALPLMKGVEDCSYEDFAYALAVGVSAPFYLSKLLAAHFAKDGSIINISSSRDRMSQPQTESYSAAKGGIYALTHALAASLAGRVRVNSISPGWIDTWGAELSAADHAQQPVGRVGRAEDVVEMILFLCSDKAGFISGENICIDGGMTRQMIYHGEHGWSYCPPC